MRNPDLSESETLVLRHITGGYNTKEIARLLDVSPRTVETHRLNFRRKFGLRTKRDLFVFSRERGIQAV